MEIPSDWQKTVTRTQEILVEYWDFLTVQMAKPWSKLPRE